MVNPIVGIIGGGQLGSLLAKAAKKIKAKEKKIFIECSGGINENNFRKYLTTGIDAISIGAITHSAPTADIRLEIKT